MSEEDGNPLTENIGVGRVDVKQHDQQSYPVLSYLPCCVTCHNTCSYRSVSIVGEHLPAEPVEVAPYDRSGDVHRRQQGVEPLSRDQGTLVVRKILTCK